MVFSPQGIERDSLNSYDAEDDDFGGSEEEENEVELEEEDDELFDEIVYEDDQVVEVDSEPQQRQRCEARPKAAAERPLRPRRRDPRYADYVNLADFCTVRDEAADVERNGDGADVAPYRTSLPYLYADILRTQPAGAPGAPVARPHTPVALWEQRLYRSAEKCLSVVESSAARAHAHASLSPAPSAVSSTAPGAGPGEPARFSQASTSMRDQSPAKFSAKHSVSAVGMGRVMSINRVVDLLISLASSFNCFSDLNEKRI